MIRKEVILKGKDFFSTHLEIINPLLPVHLTKNEIKILSLLLEYNNDKALKENYSNYRNYIRKSINITSQSLYNYIAGLVNKGAILDKDTGEVNMLLIPNNREEYFFRLIREF